MKKETGFVLMEVLLYVAVLSIIGGAMMYFVLNIYWLNESARSRENTLADLRVSMERINFLIRNAEEINESESSFDTTNGLLRLEAFGSSAQIDIFVDNGIIFVESGNGREALTSSETNISELNFTNRGSADGESDAVYYSIEARPARIADGSGVVLGTITSGTSVEVRGKRADRE